MSKLALSLARAQFSVQCGAVFRIMLEFNKFPPMDVWKIGLFHLVKTDVGSFLASDLLVEVCECYLSYVEVYGVKNVKHLKLMKPDTVIFNLVLDACVRFRTSLRAEQIIELMAVMGVVADASSVVLIAQVHEMNGQRDEVRKLKECVDRVPVRLLFHYRQFYNSLLSLHFKFDDIDSASELVLDMYSRRDSGDRKDTQKSYLHTIGSRNLKTGLRLQIEPELLQSDMVRSVGSHAELVMFMDGRLIPSNKAIAKVIDGYKRHRKIGELSKLLTSVQKQADASGDASLSSDVLGACVHIRWLETAHDILDDMETAGFPMQFDAYLSLLRAYCKENMLKEGRVLIKQMRKRGWLLNLSDEDVVSDCCLEEGRIVSLDTESVTLSEKSHLAVTLMREFSEEDGTMPLVYEINSSIYYFCKGNMMEDALRTYHRMQERNIPPIVQTFAHLINGYSKLKMYREITILWGEIRRKLDTEDLTANRDLYGMFLCNFIRGGYFERVLEVLEYMKVNGMYTDKWKYKREFLKFHKYLYRSLKAEKAKTEAQRKRLEHVRAFRKWVAID
ncbi:hypothetical protein IFM89_000456 [Coptis chinensis]|uniref:Pentatricopeptide repeat-containing protein n=1 Tax=Coptis chinensis TaxID=261450 RepID=A0A835M3D6_9MAGN|nr:hypothetical protein IFM89_000456 [Coptis chinensis]